MTRERRQQTLSGKNHRPVDPSGFDGRATRTDPSPFNQAAMFFLPNGWSMLCAAPAEDTQPPAPAPATGMEWDGLSDTAMVHTRDQDYGARLIPLPTRLPACRYL